MRNVSRFLAFFLVLVLLVSQFLTGSDSVFAMEEGGPVSGGDAPLSVSGGDSVPLPASNGVGAPPAMSNGEPDVYYDVTLDPVDGLGVSETNLRVKAGEGVTLPTPTKEGYEFKGWKDEASGEVYFDSFVPEGGVTLKAQWEVQKFTLTFDVNGGDGANQEIEVEYNTAIPKEQVTKPTRPGYEFAYWSTDQGETYNSHADGDGDCFIDTMWDRYSNHIKEDVTYYAVWRKVSGFTVRDHFMNLQGEEILTLTRPTELVKQGDRVSCPEILASVFDPFNVGAYWTETNHISQPLDAWIQKQDTSALDLPAEDHKWGRIKRAYILYRVDYNITHVRNGRNETVSGSMSEPEKHGTDLYLGVKEWWIGDGYLADDSTVDYYYIAIPESKYVVYLHFGDLVDGEFEESGIDVYKHYDKVVQPYFEPILDAGEFSDEGGYSWGNNTYSIYKVEYKGHTFDTLHQESNKVAPDFGAPLRDKTFTREFSGEVGDGEVRSADLSKDPDGNLLYCIGETRFDVYLMRNNYRVTLDVNGGDPLDESVLWGRPGESVKLPTPTKKGYDFEGWKDEATGGLYTDSYKVAGKDVTLKAQWKAKELTLTVDMDGGTMTYQGRTCGSAEIKVPYGSRLQFYKAVATVNQSNLTDFKKGFISLSGWLVNGEPQSSNTFVMTEDMTIKAQWETDVFTLTLDMDGGTVICALPDQGYPYGEYGEVSVKVSPGSQVDLSSGYIYAKYINLAASPKKDGLRLTGWLVNGEQKPVSYRFTMTEDTTAKAIFEKMYSVSFSQDGGGKQTTSYYRPGEKVKDSDVSWAERMSDFPGWVEKSTGKFYATAVGYEVTHDEVMLFKTVYDSLYHDNTLYFNVTLDPDGGQGVTDSSLEVEEGDSVELPTPTKEGFEFKGWKDEASGKVYEGSFTPENDVVLKAQWAEQEYTVTFDVAGGNPLENPVLKCRYGEEIQLPTPTHDGDVMFMFWRASEKVSFTNSGHSGTHGSLTDFRLVYTVTGDVTLYAIWSPTATVEAAGGTIPKGYYDSYSGDKAVKRLVDFIGSVDTLDDADSYDVKTERGVLSGARYDYCSVVQTYGVGPQAPTREGYVFDGWEVSAPGVGSGYFYNPEVNANFRTVYWEFPPSPYHFGAEDAKKIEEYAVANSFVVRATWKKENPPVTPSNPPEPSGSGDEEDGPGTTPTTPTEPSKPGNEGGTPGGTTPTTPTEPSKPSDEGSQPGTTPTEPSKPGDEGSQPGTTPTEPSKPSDEGSQPGTTPTEPSKPGDEGSTTPTAPEDGGKTVFHVTLDPNGGSGVVDTSLDVEGGGSATLPTPAREGYVFVGWEDEATGRSYFNGFTPDGDVTLKAKWVKERNGRLTEDFARRYKVSLDVNGGDPLAQSEYWAEEGDVIELPTPQRKGYSFGGWSLDGEDCGTSYTVPGASVTLKAVWMYEEPKMGYYDEDALPFVLALVLIFIIFFGRRR